MNKKIVFENVTGNKLRPPFAYVRGTVWRPWVRTPVPSKSFA